MKSGYNAVKRGSVSLTTFVDKSLQGSDTAHACAIHEHTGSEPQCGANDDSNQGN